MYVEKKRKYEHHVLSLLTGAVHFNNKLFLPRSSTLEEAVAELRNGRKHGKLSTLLSSIVMPTGNNANKAAASRVPTQNQTKRGPSRSRSVKETNLDAMVAAQAHGTESIENYEAVENTASVLVKPVNSVKSATGYQNVNQNVANNGDGQQLEDYDVLENEVRPTAGHPPALPTRPESNDGEDDVGTAPHSDDEYEMPIGHNTASAPARLPTVRDPVLPARPGNDGGKKDVGAVPHEVDEYEMPIGHAVAEEPGTSYEAPVEDGPYMAQVTGGRTADTDETYEVCFAKGITHGGRALVRGSPYVWVSGGPLQLVLLAMKGHEACLGGWRLHIVWFAQALGFTLTPTRPAPTLQVVNNHARTAENQPPARPPTQTLVRNNVWVRCVRKACHMHVMLHRIEMPPCVLIVMRRFFRAVQVQGMQSDSSEDIYEAFASNNDRPEHRPSSGIYEAMS